MSDNKNDNKALGYFAYPSYYRSYLITGGTGTLGQAIVKRLIKKNDIQKIVVYSRDEYKQSEMARTIEDKRIEYWLGDVCDLQRLQEASKGVECLIHTAAMKRMDSTSKNAWTVANVNITGTRNVMIASEDRPTVVVSSDKAYSPSCIYGASKMIAESVALAYPNAIVWRFGNFKWSRGSVWDIFMKQSMEGEPLTITNPNATRFVMELDEVVNYVLSNAEPGLHYPEKLKAMTVEQIAEEVCPDYKPGMKLIGMRKGEKMHEAFNENYSSDKCLKI